MVSNPLTDFKLQPFDIQPKDRHAIAVYIPWLNSGGVGEMVFDELVKSLKAEKIGALERPGYFYDFTSYRPKFHVDNRHNRILKIPNSEVYYARRDGQSSDLVLLYLPEPNHYGEDYVDLVLALMEKLSVTRYTIAGAGESEVPHTRPILVTGQSSDIGLVGKLKRIGVRISDQYQGPTSILNTIDLKLQERGITSVSLSANIPFYLHYLPSHLSVREDHMGTFRVLQALSELEELGIQLDALETKGNAQYDQLKKDLSTVLYLDGVKRLEESYDRYAEEETTNTVPPLSPDIENFMRGLENRFGRN